MEGSDFELPDIPRSVQVFLFACLCAGALWSVSVVLINMRIIRMRTGMATRTTQRVREGTLGAREREREGEGERSGMMAWWKRIWKRGGMSRERGRGRETGGSSMSMERYAALPSDSSASTVSSSRGVATATAVASSSSSSSSSSSTTTATPERCGVGSSVRLRRLTPAAKRIPTAAPLSPAVPPWGETLSRNTTTTTTSNSSSIALPPQKQKQEQKQSQPDESNDMDTDTAVSISTPSSSSSSPTNPFLLPPPQRTLAPGAAPRSSAEYHAAHHAFFSKPLPEAPHRPYQAAALRRACPSPSPSPPHVSVSPSPYASRSASPIPDLGGVLEAQCGEEDAELRRGRERGVLRGTGAESRGEGKTGGRFWVGDWDWDWDWMGVVEGCVDRVVDAVVRWTEDGGGEEALLLRVDGRVVGR